MTAAEARYHRASRGCHRAWLRSQPQYVIPGLLDELDEPHRHQRAVRFVEPAGLTAGAEPCYATPEGPTAVRPRVAPSASPPSGGSAPLSSDGPGALPSKSALRGHWR